DQGMDDQVQLHFIGSHGHAPHDSAVHAQLFEDALDPATRFPRRGEIPLRYFKALMQHFTHSLRPVPPGNPALNSVPHASYSVSRVARMGMTASSASSITSRPGIFPRTKTIAHTSSSSQVRTVCALFSPV